MKKTKQKARPSQTSGEIVKRRNSKKKNGKDIRHLDRRRRFCRRSGETLYFASISPKS
jgi:hypothetical protein